MDAEEFYNQEMNEKPSIESCFANTIGIAYGSEEMEHSKDEMIAFAEAYHKMKLKRKDMNFTKYWELNKELFEQMGTSKAIAKKIWSDCIDAVEL